MDQIPQLLDLSVERDAPALPDRDRALDETRVKIAGFGGQGVILLGRLLARAGMLAGREVSWLPSYGPEMRGGTANCSVTISQQEIGSPLIQHPTHLVAMNGPSLERFLPEVEPGGVVFYNSSMIENPAGRDDVRMIAVPVNEIADGLGQAKVGNMVMLGAMLRSGCGVSEEAVVATLPALGRPELVEMNRRALEAGGAATQGG